MNRDNKNPYPSYQNYEKAGYMEIESLKFTSDKDGPLKGNYYMSARYKLILNFIILTRLKKYFIKINLILFFINSVLIQQPFSTSKLKSIEKKRTE